MAINLAKILDDHKIEYRMDGKELSSGWIALACPWCSDDKTHLGYSESVGVFTCWRCGPKNDVFTLARILKIPAERAKVLIKTNYIPGTVIYERKRAKEVFLPSNPGKLLDPHKKYLRSRGFKPDELERDWGLVASMDDKEFKNRIIIPIYYKGVLVSFHSRDITGKALAKAKPCPKEKEAISKSKLLYGIDNIIGNTVIVSEGPFDVWRWGGGAVSTFGIKCSENQLNLLRCFKNIFIAFDSEKLAQKQAERIADKISVFQNVWVVDIGSGDPADLKQKKANKIKKKMLKMANNYGK